MEELNNMAIQILSACFSHPSTSIYHGSVK